MPNLTFDQQQSIAALVENPGYMLLVDSLQAQLDDLTQALEDVKSDIEERRIVTEWRVLRRVLAQLRTTPAAVAEALEPLKQDMSALMPFAPQTGEDFQRLSKFFGPQGPPVPFSIDPEE